MVCQNSVQCFHRSVQAFPTYLDWAILASNIALKTGEKPTLRTYYYEQKSKNF